MAGYFVYMLLCDNNTYYTGYTSDLLRRFKAHLDGKCKYTRSFKPLKIAQSWSIDGDKGEAMRVERFIKSLSRQQKEALLCSPQTISSQFSCVPWVGN